MTAEELTRCDRCGVRLKVEGRMVSREAVEVRVTVSRELIEDPESCGPMLSTFLNNVLEALDHQRTHEGET